MYRPSEILYYRYFYNNIYAIDDKQNVSVKYNIDFGENNMPFDLSWRDEYDVSISLIVVRRIMPY